ncbi:Cysteine-rich receptor-like protein [Drosera capensis]
MNGSKEDDIEKLAAQEQKHFSYEYLSKATDKFNPDRKLGEGGFGPVYKGRLGDGREVAVKMLSRGSKQGKQEFTTEAKLLARVQHRNVVKLLGYCMHGNEKLLVYEYVVNESLDKLLFKPDKKVALDWNKRYDIISGVAKGLLYLHEDTHLRIIHRDIKASNILLDEKWVPKIADFGMAKLFPEDQTHVNTRVAGTNGYMAPEYVVHGHLTVKADVYSFGVLMIELISGRRNSSILPIADDAENLLDWAYKSHKKGKSLEIVDPTLVVREEADQISMCIHIGLLCVQSDPRLRPDMCRVVVLLSKRSCPQEEPRKPGMPDTRYRRSRHGSTSSSNVGTSCASFSSTSASTTNPSTPRLITSTPGTSMSDYQKSGPSRT